MTEQDKLAQLSQYRAEWKRHPYTSVFLNDLELMREKLHECAENLSSDSTQVTKDNITNKLTSAKQIREIINYVKK
jgi:hypothetical protein